MVKQKQARFYRNDKPRNSELSDQVEQALLRAGYEIRIIHTSGKPNVSTDTFYVNGYLGIFEQLGLR